MDKYKLEYRGNVKEFEDYILENLRRESEQGHNIKWSKFVEDYARQLAIIQECPYPETESELGNDETPPSIKLLDQNTKYIGSFYRWGLHLVGIGNFRVIYCIHNYYKIVLLHQFDKNYNGAIRNEDLIQAEVEYERLCYEEPQRN